LRARMKIEEKRSFKYPSDFFGNRFLFFFNENIIL